MATRTITAMFDNRAEAEQAIQALVSEVGLSRSAVRVPSLVPTTISRSPPSSRKSVPLTIATPRSLASANRRSITAPTASVAIPCPTASRATRWPISATPRRRSPAPQSQRPEVSMLLPRRHLIALPAALDNASVRP